MGQGICAASGQTSFVGNDIILRLLLHRNIQSTKDGRNGVCMENRKITVCILSASMLQMCMVAFAGVVSGMMKAFPEYNAVTIQTCINFNCIVAMGISILSGYLAVRISKKYIVITGLSCLLSLSVFGYFFHGSIVVMFLWFGIMGLGLGLYIPVVSSLMADYFDDKGRSKISGMQTSLINLGGVILTFLGGMLADIAWYSTFLVFILALPVIIIAVVNLPRQNKTVPEERTGEMVRMPVKAWYYPVVVFVYMMLYNVYMSNISLLLGERGFSSSSMAGLSNAVFMLGGVFCGFFFDRLSARFRDFLFSIGFLIQGMGFLVVSQLSSLPLMMAVSFVAGAGLSCCLPRCIYAIISEIPAEMATIASALVYSIAPNVAIFVSPSVFSVLSDVIEQDGAKGKFGIAGILSLAFAVVTCAVTKSMEHSGEVKKHKR